MKILLISSSMRSGGAERVISILANEYINRGDEVVLAILDNRNSFYPLDSRIKLVHLLGNNSYPKGVAKLYYFFLIVSRIRGLIRQEQPNIINSHLTSMNKYAILANLFMRYPLIVSEHMTFDRKETYFQRFLRFHFIALADKVTILTEHDNRLLRSKLPNKVVMANPCSFSSADNVISKEKIILACGNIDRYFHKGFDRLLLIWSTICNDFPEWKLQIAGDGSDKSKSILLKIINDKKLYNSVEFLGEVQDMKPLYNKSAVFILSSRYEGFGMVLVEAMSQGCCCVSYDCIAGPSEIISHGIDGILVDNQDEKAMAVVLHKVLGDEDLRYRMGRTAIKNAKRFSVNNIVDKWKTLFDSLSKSNR